MFVPVGTISELAAGTMRAYDVGGTRVTIAAAADALYAFDDTCTHLGCSLARGSLDGTTVTCACHGSQFDITTGEVLRGPASRPVRARKLRVDGEEVAVET